MREIPYQLQEGNKKIVHNDCLDPVKKKNPFELDQPQ